MHQDFSLSSWVQFHPMSRGGSGLPPTPKQARSPRPLLRPGRACPAFPTPSFRSWLLLPSHPNYSTECQVPGDPSPRVHHLSIEAWEATGGFQHDLPLSIRSRLQRPFLDLVLLAFSLFPESELLLPGGLCITIGHGCEASLSSASSDCHPPIQPFIPSSLS